MIFSDKKGKQKSQRLFLTFFPKGKKGMGVSQVFIFIIAAITFALIMIFGYQSVTDFIKSGEDVSFVQFKTGLENNIKKIYTEYGSVRIKDFTLPQKYEQICFVNMDADDDPELCEYDQVACSVWQDIQEFDPKERYKKAEENVFLKPVAPVKIKVYKIMIDYEDKDYLCLPIANGAFELYMEGKGDKTSLSIPD